MFTRKATKAEVRPSVAFSESDIEQAEKMFNDPNNSEHQFMLGCLLIKSQQEEKLNRAVQIFGTLRDHPSYKRESLYYTALAHSKMGEVFDAKVFVTRLLKMDRDHKSAKVLLDEVDSKIHQMRVERKSLLESSNQKNKFNLFKSTAETDEISDFKRLKVRKTEFYDESPVRSGSIFLTNSFFDEDELIKRIPADQVSQLVESFYSLDMFSRKSNTIDREQFCNALGILGLEASFFIHKYLFKGFSAIERRFGASALADVRRVTIFKEGQEITLNTYLCGMAILLYGTEEEQANFSFGMFDTEDKDYLVEDDIYYALQAICEQLAVMGLEIPPLEETTTAIFTLLDFAGTGHVTRDQFKENLKQNRHLISSLCLFDKFELLMPDCTARGNHSLFATEEWDYALGLMIGLRMSQDMYKPMIREPLMEDFGLEVTFKIPNFKPKKSDEESDNKFVEFAPRVFQKLRDKAGISEAEFMYSLGPEQLLGNLLFGRLASLRVQDSEGSGGRSGASFLFSHDGKFIVKNISAQEFENFKRTLPEYYNYLNQNPNSLITRVYACFIFDGRGFIIMKNVFSTHRRVDEIYDLKGSTVARSSPDGPVYKDMDLTQKIFLGKPKRTKLLSVIYKDIKFLNDLGFTDYSLLIGIHYVDGYEGKKIQDMKNMAAARSAGNWANGINLNFDHFDSNGDSKQTNGTVIESAADEFDMIKVIQVPQDKLRQRRNTSGTDRKLSIMSARTIAKESQREKLLFDTYTTSGTIDHGMLSADSKQIYYLGIIDTLTEFSLSKSVELNLKTIKYGVKKRKEISSQPPDEYAQRIRTYIDRIIQ